MWRQNKMLLKIDWVNEEIKEEIKKFLETNENENIPHQLTWDAAKVFLRGKIITIEAQLNKQEKNPNKQSQTTPNSIRKRRI